MDRQYSPTSKPFLLALDQGSQSTRACVFNQQGDLIYQASSPVPSERLDELRVEQNGDAILKSIDDCLLNVLKNSGIQTDQISAVGLACQRSSVLAWDVSTGSALSPILSWQDTRMADFVASISDHHAHIHKLSGLPCSAHYGASKIAWLLNLLQPITTQGFCVSPVASFYINHLLQSTDGPMIDHANALRTQLVALESLNWESELLDLFKVEPTGLPDIVPIRHQYGRVKLLDAPLTAVNGDQTAALFSNGAFDDGTALVNLGTGGFILMPSSTRLQIPGLLSSVCDSDSDSVRYVCEGTVNGAGSALKWARRRLLVDEWDFDALAEQQSHPDLLFINTVSGLGSPWWKTGIEPYWCELSGRCVHDPNPQHALFAVLESIVFLVWFNLQRMQDGGCGIQRLVISGGLSNVDFICQRLADLSQMPVSRLAESEATARGVAYLAGGNAEQWTASFGRCFNPQRKEPLNARYGIFEKLLKTF